jgi:hypothetical protein
VDSSALYGLPVSAACVGKGSGGRRAGDKNSLYRIVRIVISEGTWWGEYDVD